MPAAVRLADSPPKFVSQSKSFHSNVGQSVVLEVIVSGTPLPNLQVRITVCRVLHAIGPNCMFARSGN